jgi:hypothetical protein
MVYTISISHGIGVLVLVVYPIHSFLLLVLPFIYHIFLEWWDKTSSIAQILEFTELVKFEKIQQ